MISNLRNTTYYLSILVSLLLFFGCKPKEDQNQGEHNKNTLFKLLPHTETGVDFSNDIIEDDRINILQNYYVYNGAGVAVGDFNNDSLPDIYFSGNMVSSKLYLNQGSLKFQDITEVSGTGTNFWATGVSVVDINHDGWQDIYVSAGVYCQNGCPNRLFVNQGLNENQIPTFKESALEYGIAYHRSTTHTTFLDYDRDGDLDLFLIKNTVTPINKNLLLRKDSRFIQGKTIDKLHRNNGPDEKGQIRFEDVSTTAGIVHDGYSLGVAVNDINNDGWPDIYVANDFNPDDLLYINQKDGTFKDMGKTLLKHHTFNGMGVDVADFNNDGLADIMVLDMLPEDNQHQKTMLTPMNYDFFDKSIQLGYAPQYMRNTLQLNNGLTSNGQQIPFSEIGQLAGIYQTDWSWAALFADFDLDGYKDLYITNGFVRDMTDLDFINYGKASAMKVPMQERKQKLLELYKSLDGDHLPNYMYRNEGGYSFSDKSTTWGLNQPSYSNGAAYADLDNDGDLDLIVNNINEKAFIYENTAAATLAANYIKIKLKGKSKNLKAIGAKVEIWYGDHKYQSRYHAIHKGYLSTMESGVHFGLGTSHKVDSMRITWPNGENSMLTAVMANQTLHVSYTNEHTQPPVSHPSDQDNEIKFNEVDLSSGIVYQHKENKFIDFKQQPLLLEMNSRHGPALAVGNIDGSYGGDFYIGGAAGFPGAFFTQRANGTFRKQLFTTDSLYEDTDAVLFDADNDGDDDLYVVSGGSSSPAGDKIYQDRLYLNDGNGNWQKATDAVPPLNTSGSVVRAADYDKDGDLDLFVGGRVVPGRYPDTPESYLLINQKGKFKHQNDQSIAGLKTVGMVTDAIWTDFDGNGWLDLIVACEWKPIQFFQNQKGTLKPWKPSGNFPSGLWNSISAGDFDEDGDMDLIAGNIGLNTYLKASPVAPVRLYATDFDDNGSIDPIFSMYIKDHKGGKKEYPIHPRDAIIGQLQYLKKRIKTYDAFGEADIHGIFDKAALQKANQLKVERTASYFFKNEGDGKFTSRPLPVEAQFSVIKSIVSKDINGDGHLDLIIAGNSFATESNQGWYDAGNGLCLIGDGKGHFKPIHTKDSNLILDKCVSSLAIIDNGNRELLLAGVNNDSIKAYQLPKKVKPRK